MASRYDAINLLRTIDDMLGIAISVLEDADCDHIPVGDMTTTIALQNISSQITDIHLALMPNFEPVSDGEPDGEILAGLEKLMKRPSPFKQQA